MTAYVIRRVLWMFPLLFAVATITFVLMHLTPGGPFDVQEKLQPAQRETLARRYNLDKPIHEQYLYYLGDISPVTYEPPFFKTPDLGESFTQRGRTVNNIISDGFWVSAQLGLMSFLFAVIVGMSLGIMSALNQNRLPDYLGVFFATLGAAVPSFVMATLLAWLFSVELGWTDRLGWEFGNFRKMTLPVVSLGLLPAAFIARITRASMLEVMRQDFIRTARSKGLAEWVVIMRHVVKNSLIPVLTVAGPIFAVLVTGSFIIERIFQINGIGRPFVDAVFRRDYGVIMGTTLFFATTVAIANLVVDVLYAAVDPRIRYG
ncbi:MAG TPA: ABC transporter permease [Dehalococcoidia bacterium]|nr:ABC transporter permease [Dehalococcoidia bacterium]